MLYCIVCGYIQFNDLETKQVLFILSDSFILVNYITAELYISF